MTLSAPRAVRLVANTIPNWPKSGDAAGIFISRRRAALTVRIGVLNFIDRSTEINMANANVSHVTDANFEQEVLKSDQPVLVDFWAPWCGPCKAIAPLLDELAVEYAGRLKVVKINVDDNPQTPQQYNVRGIPNLLIIKGGQVANQIVGAVPKRNLVQAVDSAIA
jgi:thioredoxin